MNNKKRKVVSTRKRYNLEKKLEIIEANESGKTCSMIATEQGMNEDTIRTILRKKEFYKTLRTSTSYHRFKSFVRHRNQLLDEVEEQLVAWIQDNKQKKIHLTEKDIQRKALALFNELKPSSDCTEKFSASRGWFTGFKSRLKRQKGIISGEKPTPNKEEAERFCTEIAKIVQDGGYTNHQIFNVEETSLYWKRLPSQSFLPDGEKNQSGCKPSKDSFTLLLGSNAAGDFKLKPMIVYHSETPSTLQKCDQLPVTWRSNKKACLTKDLFQEWFTNYFCPTTKQYCQDSGLEFKILLLLDFSPTHDVLNVNSNIRVVFFPQNTASLLQPMTLGVFPVLKANYLMQILLKASASIYCTPINKFWSSYNLNHAVKNVFKCWCDISKEDLAAAWHRLLPDVKVMDHESQIAAIVKDVVTMGQYLGFKTIDVQNVQNCIDSTFQDLDSPTPEFEEEISNEDENNDCN